MERNDFRNIGRGSPKKDFCETILKSGYWFRRKCYLKFVLALAPFVQQSGTISAILIEGHLRKISVKLF